MHHRVLRLVGGAGWLAVVVGAWLTAAAGPSLIAPLFAVPGYGTVGGILTLKRPTNPIGWLLLLMASAPLLDRVIGLNAETQNGLVVIGLALVLVIFPTGSPMTPRWFIPMLLAAGSWLALPLLGAVSVPGAFEIPLGTVAAAGSLLVCVTAPVVRFRRSQGVERSQLRWLGAAARVSGGALAVAAVGFATGSDALAQGAGSIAFFAFGFGIPGAILIAILRYHLYDIDRLVGRTVTYTLVALVVGVAYAAPVLLLPQLIGVSGDLVTAGATLAAATAFRPAHRRIRDLVARRWNRPEYDPVRLVARLSAGVRDESDHGAIGAALGMAVTEALHPAGVDIWLRFPG